MQGRVKGGKLVYSSNLVCSFYLNFRPSSTVQNSHFLFFGQLTTFLCPLRGLRHTEHLRGTWCVSRTLVSVSSTLGTKKKEKQSHEHFICAGHKSKPNITLHGHIICKAQLILFKTYTNNIDVSSNTNKNS